MQRLVLIALLLLAACGGPTGSGLQLPDDPAALSWGDGPYGLVLVPHQGNDAASWERVASTLAGDGMTVVAVSSPDAAAVLSALRHLLDDPQIERAAVLGAGAGGEVAIQVAAQEPALVDQLIVLSVDADVSELGEMPKLFVASGDEPAAAAAERMAGEAAGAWNELYLAAGSASGQAILDGEGRDGALEAIQRRLDERR